MYNNNVAPYSTPPTIANNHLVFDELTDWDPLAKLFLVDTYHDLAQARDGYDPAYFISKIIPNIIDFKKNIQMNGNYRGTIEKMFGKEVLVSNLEPTMNAHIENKYGLQPADERVTFSEIIAHDLSFNQAFHNTVVNSNGSIKITVPPPYTSFTHYLTQFTDPISYLDAQTRIARFIKNYLYQDLKDIKAQDLTKKRDPTKDVKEIRFLFDAGANQIGKIFRYPGSGGIRYNSMACTADSACSSDEGMDPSVPKEYENIGVNNPKVNPSVKVTSNFFSSEKYDIHFIVNDYSHFGQDGTKCFSVNFTNKPKPGEPSPSPTDFNVAARYFFGARKNKQFDERDPCGSEGGSVSRIGMVMRKLETIMTEGLPLDDQKKALNSVVSGHCIPVGDSRFLKLFDPTTGIQTDTEIYDLEKLLADYKRTGDYEQSLSLKRMVLNGNPGNYTFSSVDLLSTLFARLNGIPAVYQVGTNGTITLYRNDKYRGDTESRQKADELAEGNKKLRIQSQRLKIFDELKTIIDQEELIELLKQLKDAQYDDRITRIQVDGILFVFNKVMEIMASVQPPISDEPSAEQEIALNKMVAIYRFLENQKSFKSVLNKGLNIKRLEDVNNFALPWLDLSIRFSRTKFSEKMAKLLVEEKVNNAKIAKYDNIFKPNGPEEPPTRDRFYYEKQMEIREKLKNEKKIILASIEFGPAEFGEISGTMMEGGGGKSVKKTQKKINYRTVKPTAAKTQKNKPYREKIRVDITNRTNINYKKVEREVLSIVRTVLNSSNNYLSDLYGTEASRNKSRNTSPLLTGSMDESPTTVNVLGVRTTRKKRSRSASPNRNKKKTKFVLAYYTTIVLSDYSDDVALYLSSLFVDFMSSLENLILMYNYEFEPTSMKLTMKNLFQEYKILSFILGLCCQNTKNNMTTRYEGNKYTLNSLISEEINTSISDKMNGVVGTDGIALSIFALSGYYMGDYTTQDYCIKNTDVEFTETKTLLKTTNTSPTDTILLDYVDAFNHAITLLSREGAIHAQPFVHDTRTSRN